MRVLGLMSGTSCDGLDCCDVNVDLDNNYNFKFKINNFSTEVYLDKEKFFLLSLRNKHKYKSRSNEIKLTNIFIEKINSFTRNDISLYDLIACHGHTVLHIDKVVSKQLIDAKLLWDYYQKPITNNFRQSDIRHGGNGAPLMPFLDYLLFQNYQNDVITINVGGISNITYIPKVCSRFNVKGFDTGPGMSLIDKTVEILFNDTIDENAIYSSKGKVDSVLLSHLMQNSYVNSSPPKSTDINEFGYAFLDKIIEEYSTTSSFNIIRTLVEYTIQSILFNINKFINIKNFELIYSGGGTLHPIISDGLGQISTKYNSISKYGIDSSTKEALLIAVLGVARLKDIPSNLPSVTGANKFIVLGDLYDR